MEAVLVTRVTPPATDSTAPAYATTSDFTLTVDLQDLSLPERQVVSQLPSSEWAGSTDAGAHPGVAQANQQRQVDNSYKPHALSGFSEFGSGDPNEFATFTQGREKFLSDNAVRESYEDDLRSFAERSDHTEGFMITSPISTGFGGFSSCFLEMLRDEFAKQPVWTTATRSDAHGWKREDTERSKNQRLINDALSLAALEELSSIVMPVQPTTSWEKSSGWTNYLRDDVDTRSSYSTILTQHIQSANSELREAGALHSITSQLNWRGDNKFAHILGASPALPPDHLAGEAGQEKLRRSIYDFSVQRKVLTEEEREAGKVAKERSRADAYAQYTVVRGYEGDELERLGEVLEKSTKLKEPLVTWVCLPQPYPILPSAPPIYRSLLPSGQPLVLSAPIASTPFTPAGLFGAPDTSFPLSTSYIVQPTSVPIYTSLSTTPDTRYLLQHLTKSVRELRRVRWAGWWEYDQGEYALGREGVDEMIERLESRADALRGAGGAGDDEEPSDGMDSDEWHEEGGDSDIDLE